MKYIKVTEVKGRGFYFLKTNETGTPHSEAFLDYESFYSRIKDSIEQKNCIEEFEVVNGVVHVVVLNFEDLSFSKEEYLLEPINGVQNGVIEELKKFSKRFLEVKDVTHTNIDIRIKDYFSLENIMWVSDVLVSHYKNGKSGAISKINPTILEKVKSYIEENIRQDYRSLVIKYFKDHSFEIGACSLILILLVFCSWYFIGIPLAVSLLFPLTSCMLLGSDIKDSVDTQYYSIERLISDIDGKIEIYKGKKEDNDKDFSVAFKAFIQSDRELAESISDEERKKILLNRIAGLERNFEYVKAEGGFVIKKAFLDALVIIEKDICEASSIDGFGGFTRELLEERLDLIESAEVLRDDNHLAAFWQIADRIYAIPYPGCAEDLLSLLRLTLNYIIDKNYQPNVGKDFLLELGRIEERVVLKINKRIDASGEVVIEPKQDTIELGKQGKRIALD
ncbi:MAG TPA: hypothetical protein DCY94_00445 [Firmicutes bacterium]|nr:hypothetical protein [Bacillota bacterium]